MAAASRRGAAPAGARCGSEQRWVVPRCHGCMLGVRLASPRERGLNHHPSRHTAATPRNPTQAREAAEATRLAECCAREVAAEQERQRQHLE